MVNERNTENLVRNMLKDAGYYDNHSIVIEEQASKNPRIDKLLSTASKKGNSRGRPEFIISFIDKPDDLIVIECKASIFKHESKDRKNYANYAVDGVLLYASYLKKGFNVTAIGVSGENHKEKKISSFLWLKNHLMYKAIQDKILLKPNEITALIKQTSEPFNEEELIKKAIEYNSFLHSYSVKEDARCTLISAILISLQDEAFLNGFKYNNSNHSLIESMLLACNNVLETNGLSLDKRNVIISEYEKFKNNNSFSSDIIIDKKTKQSKKNTLLKEFIFSISQEILPHIQESQFDVLGKFYTQFIRYAGSDKNTGLVLTPTHITDFFCEIAELNTDDVVLDPCCGTSGFLVSAMNYMLKKAGNNIDKQKQIKKSQLIGVETRPDMFSHACSNMMMRGDGKSHVIFGDFFVEKNKNQVKSHKPTKGFLNPPYKDKNTVEQLEFIENTLECLTMSGTCIAICQMSTVVSNNKDVIAIRERLLERHTLKAVFSMPNDLFYPVAAAITCILVFEAHKPHLKNRETFFGYFKEDGFIKKKSNKNSRRIDSGKWSDIKNTWLDAYRNNKTISGLSITKVIDAKNEWCAEAYMETNYNTLTEEDFIKSLKEYVVFNFLQENN